MRSMASLVIVTLMVVAGLKAQSVKEFFSEWNKVKTTCTLNMTTASLSRFNEAGKMSMKSLFVHEEKSFVLLNHNPRVDGFDKKKSVGDGQTIVISARFTKEGRLCALYNKISSQLPQDKGDHRYIFFDDCSAEKPALKFYYRNVRKKDQIDVEAKVNQFDQFDKEDLFSTSLQLNQGLTQSDRNFVVFEGNSGLELYYSIFLNYGGGSDFGQLDKGIYRLKVFAHPKSKAVKQIMIEVPRGVVSAQLSLSNDLGGLCGGIDRTKYVGFQNNDQELLYISDQITDELMAEYWNRRNLAYLGLIPLPQLPEGTQDELSIEDDKIECESRDSMAYFKSFNGVHLNKNLMAVGKTYVLFEYDKRVLVTARYKNCGSGGAVCHCGFTVKLRNNEGNFAEYFHVDRCQSNSNSDSDSRFIGKYFLKESLGDKEKDVECKEEGWSNIEPRPRDLSCKRTGNLVEIRLETLVEIGIQLQLVEGTSEIERIKIVLPRNDNNYKCQTRGICAQEVADGCSRYPSLPPAAIATTTPSTDESEPEPDDRLSDSSIQLDAKTFVSYWAIEGPMQEKLVWDIYGPKEAEDYFELKLGSMQTFKTMVEKETFEVESVTREFIGQQLLLYKSEHEGETVMVFGSFKRCQGALKFDNKDGGVSSASVCLCGLYLKTVTSQKITYAFIDYCRNLRRIDEKNYELMIYDTRGDPPKHERVECDLKKFSKTSHKNSALWAEVKSTEGFKCARFMNDNVEELVIRTEFLKNNIKIEAEIKMDIDWEYDFLSDKFPSVKIYPSMLGKHGGLGAVNITNDDLDAAMIRTFRADKNFVDNFKLDRLYPLGPAILSRDQCHIYGDPHIITFDKTKYSVQTTQDHYVLYELDDEIMITGTFERCNTKSNEENSCMCSVYLRFNTRNPADQTDTKLRTVFVDLCGGTNDVKLRKPRWVKRDIDNGYLINYSDLDCSEPFVPNKFVTDENFWMKHPDFFVKCSSTETNEQHTFYIRVVHETEPDADSLLVLKISKFPNPVYPLDFELYPSKDGVARAKGLCKGKKYFDNAENMSPSELDRRKDLCMCTEKAAPASSYPAISDQKRLCDGTLPMGVCVSNTIYKRDPTRSFAQDFIAIDDTTALHECENALVRLKDNDVEYQKLLETCKSDLKTTGNLATSKMYGIAATESSLKKDLEKEESYRQDGGIKFEILQKYNISCQAKVVQLGADGKTLKGGCSGRGVCHINTNCTKDTPCDPLVKCVCEEMFAGSNCQDKRLFGIPIELDRTCCDHVTQECSMIAGRATDLVEFPLPEDAPLYAQIIVPAAGKFRDEKRIIVRAYKEPDNRFFINLPDTFEDFTAANFVMNISLSMDKDPEKFGRYAQVTVFDSSCRSCTDGHIEQTLAPDSCLTSRGMCSTRYIEKEYAHYSDEETSEVSKCHEKACSGQLKVAVVIQSSSTLVSSETSRSRMLELLGEMLKTYYDHSSHMSLRFEVASATRNVRTYSSVQKRARLQELVQSTAFDHYSFRNSFMLKALENAADHLSPPEPDSYDAASHIPDTHVLIVVTDRFSNDSLLTEMAQIVNGLAANPVVNVAVLQIDDPQKEFELELDDATVRRFNFPSYASMSEALPLNRTLANDLCSTHTRFQLATKVNATFTDIKDGTKFFEFGVDNPILCKTYELIVTSGSSSLSIGVDKYPFNAGESTSDYSVRLKPVDRDSIKHVYANVITSGSNVLKLTVTCRPK